MNRDIANTLFFLYEMDACALVSALYSFQDIFSATLFATWLLKRNKREKQQQQQLNQKLKQQKTSKANNK